MTTKNKYNNPDGTTIWVPSTTRLGYKVQISEPKFIGIETKIGRNSIIDKNADIGHKVKIGNKVKIGRNVKIGNYVQIADNVVIGDNVSIGSISSITQNGAIIFSGAQIGDYVTTNAAFIRAGEKIKSDITYHILPIDLK